MSDMLDVLQQHSHITSKTA
jgi:hypothetical protein